MDTFRNEFYAVCETCGLKTLQTDQFETVSSLARIHSLRKWNHVLVFVTVKTEGAPGATKKRKL